jgi:O-antigen ligase
MATTVSSSFLLLAILMPLIQRTASIRRSEANEIRVRPIFAAAILIVFFSALGLCAQLFGFDFIFLPLALALGLTCVFFQPALALSAYMSLLLLRPWELVGEPGLLTAIPRIGALLVLVSWLLAAFRAKARGVVLSETLILFFAFFLWLIVSSAFTLGMAASFEFAIERWMPIAVLALVVPAVMREEVDRLAFQLSLVISALGVLATSLVETLGTQPLDQYLRLTGNGLLGNPNDLAALAVLALCLLLFQPKRSWFVTVLLSPPLVLALWSTQSRGGILAFGASCVVYALVKLKSRWMRVSIAFCAFLLVFAMMALLGRAEGDMQMSSTSRWNYVVAGVKMTLAHPLLGVGVDQYPVLYEQYTSVFYEWGERTAHSSWILALSEGGLPGALLFFALAFSVLLRAFFLRGQAPELFACIVGYLIAMSFLSHTYLFLPYVLFFLVVAAHRTTNQPVVNY